MKILPTPNDLTLHLHLTHCWSNIATRMSIRAFFNVYSACGVSLYCRLYNINRCLITASYQWHAMHDDVTEWKHFPRCWSFVRGIHRSPVDSPHKGQWLGALMFSLISARTNSGANNRDAGDLRRHGAHYDVILRCIELFIKYGTFEWYVIWQINSLRPSDAYMRQ